MPEVEVGIGRQHGLRLSGAGKGGQMLQGDGPLDTAERHVSILGIYIDGVAFFCGRMLGEWCQDEKACERGIEMVCGRISVAGTDGS